MNVVKTLWASVQGDPKFMRRLNGWLTIFWIAMIPVSIMLGLLSSVAYVSALSLWALVSGHWSAWQAARVEVAQSREAEKLERHPIEERVVEQLIRVTDIEATNTTANTATSDGPSQRLTVRADVTSLCEQIDDLAARIAVLQQSSYSIPPQPTMAGCSRPPAGLEPNRSS